ncbi:Monocarboxylate transporter 12 [Frankliniella fusca]|uniref:Monocarboxylate transporter 12 n=1 Tax=Frankliniella fusca TaxID=407009 RepID=A0AAE1HLX8_9NEOP|nr:Monocarboxylate transporter 12 [Frankliniella fusca]
MAAAVAASAGAVGRKPNGGWGWVVLAGVVLSYMTNMALFSVFGLLFGGQLEAWGLETTGVAVISSTMSSVQNFAGLGVGLLVPATFLNISAWFSTRRSQAVGISLAGTGLGQIVLPHLVRVLLEEYGFHGAVLIIGGLALHSIPGCLLYRKPRLIRDAVQPSESEPLKPKTEEKLLQQLPPPPQLVSASKEAVVAAAAEEPRGRGALAAVKRAALAMDLDLFLNLRFVNLAIGAGLTYTTMTSFSMVFPFFLMETVGYSRAATATFMSVQSGADLVSRLVLPQVMGGARCGRRGLPARTVMLVGILGSAAGRSALAEIRGFPEMLTLAAVTGFFRGATVLNQNLVIAEHVPAARLPSAIGLAMVVKGACALCIGSALGVIRDASGSYTVFIHCLTGLAVFTAVAWTLESCCCRAPGRPADADDAR